VQQAADGNHFGPGQSVQKRQQVGCIRPRRVNAHANVHFGVLLGQHSESLFELLIATPPFEKYDRLGSTLSIFSEKGDIVAIASR